MKFSNAAFYKRPVKGWFSLSRNFDPVDKQRKLAYTDPISNVNTTALTC